MFLDVGQIILSLPAVLAMLAALLLASFCSPGRRRA
jgi:hypothetical protein